MPIYFLDSSAGVKHYQPEEGTKEVDGILSEADSRFFISRLAVVEVQRVFARSVRTGEILVGELDGLRDRFYRDLGQRLLEVRRLRDFHYHSAVRLIRKYAPAQGQKQDQEKRIPLLSTLDALHLAAALDVGQRMGLDYFVCADEDLCEVAKAEQLSVINPVPAAAS